jgi:hypothetical protein
MRIRIYCSLFIWMQRPCSGKNKNFLTIKFFEKKLAKKCSIKYESKFCWSLLAFMRFCDWWILIRVPNTDPVPKTLYESYLTWHGGLAGWVVCIGMERWCWGVGGGSTLPPPPFTSALTGYRPVAPPHFTFYIFSLSL